LITNDSQIFMESVKAKVIGITGSAGKTTTTMLTGAVAKTAMEPCVKVWVGGNIGMPMIDHLEEIEPEDWVVLELSSFQLDQMNISPQIAVILNITPNHLDRHKTMQAYTEAKARILDFQDENGIAILNREDSGSIGLKGRVKGRLITFGFSKSDSAEPEIFIQDDFICYTDGTLVDELVPLDSLKLSGRHNLANAMAACAVGASLGFDPKALREGIESVTGVPHRLELIREKDGVRWYNDSIATAPERVMAALQAIDGPLVLLLGGRDKDLPWEGLAKILHTVKPKVILFGEAAELIQNALQAFEKGQPAFPIWKVDTLSGAVRQASEVAVSGESVLLSPGGTSFDAYKDFEARGEHFRQLVEELA
jgi:UDP-N-acetylmuramoylalanine--D-glutamate ligase